MPVSDHDVPFSPQTVSHLVSVKAVHGDSTPRGKHESAVEHWAQSTSSEGDHDTVGTHLVLHMRSVVGPHALRVPYLQAVALHVWQGLVPVLDQVLPLAQRERHLVGGGGGGGGGGFSWR